MSDSGTQTMPSSKAAHPADPKFETRLHPGERLDCSDGGQVPRLSIVVPAYRDDPSALITALAESEGAVYAELIVYDDGSGDSMLTQHIRDALRTYPGTYGLITGLRNAGRAHVRNRLAALASTDWIVFLDADMLPDDALFLRRYMDHIAHDREPRLIVGGHSVQAVKRSRANLLHYSQSIAGECPRAELRQEQPGRYVATGNLLVHRSISDAVSFDAGFQGWGWEDTDWGLTVARKYRIQHIDNPASHFGLCSNRELLRRYETSGANFRRLQAKHPEATSKMPLSRAVRLAEKMPAKGLLASLCRAMALDATGLVPLTLRRMGLKFARALAYAKCPPVRIETE